LRKSIKTIDFLLKNNFVGGLNNFLSCVNIQLGLQQFTPKKLEKKLFKFPQMFESKKPMWQFRIHLESMNFCNIVCRYYVCKWFE